MPGLRDLFSDKYLLKRPSFQRCRAKAARHGFELTRDDYAVLMRDIRKLRHLFEEAEVDPAQVNLKKYVVNSWGKDNFQVKAWLEPKGEDEAKESPFIPVARPPLKPAKTAIGGMHYLFIPDIHFGYFRAGDALSPVHDEDAVGVVLNVARAYQPTNIVVLGDMLDLAGFGSYTTSPAHRHLANEALQRAYDFFTNLRSVAPDANIIVLEGNHEARINRYLCDRAPEAAGIKRPGEGTPVLSVKSLLRLDEMGIEYVGPYGTHYWTPEGVRVLHGELIGKNGGDTASKMLNAYAAPSVCGHVHRLELAYKTRHEADGPTLTWAMSCGTLARLDGAVPGSAYPDWQQGFGVLWLNNQPSIHAIYGGSTGLLEQSLELPR